MAFSLSGHTLSFVTPPALPRTQKGTEGTVQLDPGDHRNTPFLEYRLWLGNSLTALDQMGIIKESKLESIRLRLISDMTDEKQRLHDLQETAWEAQCASAAAGSTGVSSEAFVDTSMYRIVTLSVFILTL